MESYEKKKNGQLNSEENKNEGISLDTICHAKTVDSISGILALLSRHLKDKVPRETSRKTKLLLKGDVRKEGYKHMPL